MVTNASNGKSFGRYHYAESNPYAKVDPDGRNPKGVAKGKEHAHHFVAQRASDAAPAQDVLKSMALTSTASRMGLQSRRGSTRECTRRVTTMTSTKE